MTGNKWLTSDRVNAPVDCYLYLLPVIYCMCCSVVDEFKQEFKQYRKDGDCDVLATSTLKFV